MEVTLALSPHGPSPTRPQPAGAHPFKIPAALPPTPHDLKCHSSENARGPERDCFSGPGKLLAPGTGWPLRSWFSAPIPQLLLMH